MTVISSVFTHQFLLAMPGMADPNFSGAVIYIAEHSDKGALGLVINRTMELDLRSLFERIALPLAPGALAGEPVFFGGPVQTDRGFVLHRPLGSWHSTVAVAEDVGLTTSKDILEALAQGDGPDEWLVAVGYAGWAPGQLEEEILRNGWLTVCADLDVVFRRAPEDRYDAALAALGVSFTALSGVAGHA